MNEIPELPEEIILYKIWTILALNFDNVPLKHKDNVNNFLYNSITVSGHEDYYTSFYSRENFLHLILKCDDDDMWLRKIYHNTISKVVNYFIPMQ